MAIRVKALWAGQKIGAGVSTFVFDDSGVLPDPTELTAVGNAVRSFFTNAGALFPSTVTVSFDPEVEAFDPASGTITDVGVMGTTPATVTGTGAALSAAGVGGRVRWRTASFRNGRRVVGTTFVVPMPTTCYDNEGTLSSATITSLTTAANALMSGATTAGDPLVIWSRPSAPGSGDGAISPVITVSVPDAVAWLRTRKDS